MKADFNRDALEAVWTPARWRCIVTNTQGLSTIHAPMDWQIVDADHILGRNRDDRVYSSVYNACPLLRQVHKNFGNVNNRWFRKFQLEKVHEVVQSAIVAGRYEPTDIDYSFLHEVVPEWERKEFPHFYEQQ